MYLLRDQLALLRRRERALVDELYNALARQRREAAEVLHVLAPARSMIRSTMRRNERKCKQNAPGAQHSIAQHTHHHSRSTIVAEAMHSVLSNCHERST